jgi:hypothetical protein
MHAAAVPAQVFALPGRRYLVSAEIKYTSTGVGERMTPLACRLASDRPERVLNLPGQK